MYFANLETPSPPPQFETREHYAHRYFTKEVYAYLQMKDVRDIQLPHCYGAYTLRLDHPSRDNEGDQILSMLVFDYMESNPLSAETFEDMSASQKQYIAREVFRIQEVLYAHDVVWGTVGPHNFRISAKSGEVVGLDFSNTVDIHDMPKDITPEVTFRLQLHLTVEFLTELEIMDDSVVPYGFSTKRPTNTDPVVIPKLDIDGFW